MCSCYGWPPEKSTKAFTVLNPLGPTDPGRRFAICEGLGFLRTGLQAAKCRDSVLHAIEIIRILSGVRVASSFLRVRGIGYIDVMRRRRKLRRIVAIGNLRSSKEQSGA